MKKILFLFAALIISASMCAQHLTYMDVPIDGRIDQVVEALVEKGMEYKGNISKDIAQLCYDSNGQPIDVLVVANEETGNVFRIGVMTQPKFNWKMLKREYEMYQKQLYEKYGVPTTYEMFMHPYNTKKMIRKRALEALINDKAVWSSFFKTYGTNDTLIGTVSLAITPYANLARVVIYYEDAANSPKEE